MTARGTKKTRRGRSDDISPRTGHNSRTDGGGDRHSTSAAHSGDDSIDSNFPKGEHQGLLDEDATIVQVEQQPQQYPQGRDKGVVVSPSGRRTTGRPRSTMQASRKKEEADRPLRSGLTMSTSSPNRSNGALEISHMGLTAILWLIGLAVIIVGSLLLSDSRMNGLQTLRHFGPLQSASILVVVIGALIIVLGIIGCLAVNTRSRPMLFIFSFFLGCLVILEIACCVLAWYNKRGTSLENRLQTLITRVIQQYGDGRAEYLSGDDDWNFNRNELTFIEYTLRCCGAMKGIEDYTSRRMAVPRSCYSREYQNYNFNYNYNQGTPYNDVGCVKALQDFLFKHGLALGLLCIFALLVEITLIVLSIILASRAASQDTEPKVSHPSPTQGKRSSPQQRSTGYVPVTQKYQPSEPAHVKNVPVQAAQEYHHTHDPIHQSKYSEDV